MGKKWKSWKNFSGLQNGIIRGLQIGSGFRDYKLGQEGLQIGAALGISNRGRDSVIMSVRKIKKDGDTEYIMSYTLTFLGTKKRSLQM